MKCNFSLVLSCLLTLGAGSAAAQTGLAVGILNPDPSAALDVSSSKLGLLVPRLSLSGANDATTVAAPANSLLVYNKATTLGGLPGLAVNTGTPTAPNWQRIEAAGMNWSLTGNQGTLATKNFLGTTDNQPLSLRVSNAEVARFMPNGALYFGDKYVRNLFLGWNAGDNTQADYDNEQGLNNLFVGTESGRNNTTGNNNTFLGQRTGSDNTEGGDNTFVGYQAGLGVLGNASTLIGSGAGQRSAGDFNTFIGLGAGYGSVGSQNEFIGQSAGRNNGGGSHNQFIGTYSGSANTSGANNSFLGYYAGAANTTGNSNQFIGYNSGINNTTGSNNVYIGAETGRRATTGSNNVFIGTQAGLPPFATTQYSNSVALGYYAQVGASNVIALGGGGTYAAKVGIGTGTPSEALQVVGNILASGTITQNSDRRLKTNIRPLDGALASVKRLRGVRYEFVPGKGPVGEQVGVIAQEVEKVYPELVRTDAVTGIKSVNYAQLTPVLLEAIKELQAQVATGKDEREQLTASLKSLARRVQALEGVAPAATAATH